ncbi:MAG: beta-ketoacyl-[acyl-carrier-protein] synthase family protein [Fibrobacter sp.]|nr:beta-ketoacyl-[acyl-carrier-protein] synthase family protein [Fibrobacter sp.]
MSVFVAGMGAISSPGTGVAESFSAVISGYDGISPLSLFDSRLKSVPLCTQVCSIPEKYRKYYRSLALAMSAADEALTVLPERKDIRLGILVATTVAGISHTEKFYEDLRKDPSLISRSADEFSVHEPTVLAGELCRHTGGCGFHTLSTACSTGLHIIGMGKRYIEQGTYDACLVVGTDALSLLTVRGFASLMLLDPNGCRPFDKRRAGISLGEGAGAMLLTAENVLSRCTRKPFAIVSGWGASADCYHMTAPHPEGMGARSAVKAALDEARTEPEQIDLIAAHGTGTPDNDKAEIKAMQSVFKSLPPFCSMKRTLGHTLAASGILESVMAVNAMCEQTVPPTAGFEIQDEEIGVSPSKAIKRNICSVLKTSFGFGGNNAAVIFSRTAC